MPFPQVRHCLICEATRPEPFGKLSLLGFYGVAPDVQIAVRHFGQPLQLAFVLISGPAGKGDPDTLGFRIVDEAGTSVVEPPASPYDRHGPTEKRLNLAIQVVAPFPHPGRYTMHLLVDGVSHFQTDFELRQGQDADFVG
jgi:hypothetical protein